MKESAVPEKTSEQAEENVKFFELPRSLKKFFNELGHMTVFLGRFFKQLFTPGYDISELLKQCYLIGVNSLGLVGITGFIMGLVLTLQSRPIMIDFGAEAMLPSMVSISIIREMGPVITALICAGKIGSGIGAELGSMNVTEQIDAMEVSATNPFKFLVVTRVIATTLMVPILVVFADTIALYGCYFAVNLSENMPLVLFFYKAFNSLRFIDLIPAVIKTFFFGMAIGVVGCYKGYFSTRGTEGVGKAANSAVVISSLVIFVIDMVAVQITSYFMEN